MLPLSAQLTLNLPSTSANCGDVLQLPVTLENADSLTKLQFSLSWDAVLLSYQEGQESLIAGGVLNTNLASDGILIFEWEDSTSRTWQVGDTLLLLEWIVTTNTITTATIQFVGENFRIEKGDLSLEPTFTNGEIALEGGSGPPVLLQGMDTVFQYTTDISCSAIGQWEIPQFQACSGEVQIESSHTQGTSFDIGSRVITYTATDEAGSSTTASFVHIVQDTIAPVISNCPANFEVNFSTDAGCDLSVVWDAPSFLERCSSTETMVSSNFNSGDNFPVGKTEVIYEAVDAAGNKSNCSFEVIVTGSDPITFDRRPENIQLSSLLGQCGATYDWELPAAVTGCAPVNLVANIQSGSFFPVGTTVVEYVATDQINQRAVWAFSVTVEDIEPMVVRCPTDIVIAANGQAQIDELSFIQSVSSNDCGTYELALNEIEVIDNCAAAITKSLVAGSASEFTKGATQMEYLITSERGETSICNFSITIQEAPPISIARSTDLACAETDLQMRILSEEENFYDTWEWSGPNGFLSFEQHPIIPLTLASTGTYQVTASSSVTGCSTTATTELEVFGLEGTPSIESDRVVICEGENFSFNTTGATGATYEWTGPDDFNSTELSVNFDQAQSTQTGEYNLVRTFEGCASPPATVRVIVLSELIISDDVINTLTDNAANFEVLSNDSIELDASYTITTFPEPVNGTLVNNGDGTFSYDPNEEFVGNDQFTYEICYDACPDLCATGLITIRTAISDEVCSFPTYLSPNGDEDNEVLLFPCNDASSLNATGGITIFNQFGAIVYQASPYNNDWEGTYKGEPLPDGTYYYIYKASADDPNPVKNCVTIFR